MYEASRGKGAQVCDCKRYRTRESGIFILIYVFISSLLCRGKERRWVPPLKPPMNVQNGERSVCSQH